jgi:hypothetical protein
MTSVAASVTLFFSSLTLCDGRPEQHIRHCITARALKTHDTHSEQHYSKGAEDT